MTVEITPAYMEAEIRRYFDACNAGRLRRADVLLHADAVHYFPPGLADIPWRGADMICRKWVWCVENLGSQAGRSRRSCARPTGPEAVIEWTHWKPKQGTALRGDEWYVFDPASGLHPEIRAYYASPARPDVADRRAASASTTPAAATTWPRHADLNLEAPAPGGRLRSSVDTA